MAVERVARFVLDFSTRNTLSLLSSSVHSSLKLMAGLFYEIRRPWLSLNGNYGTIGFSKSIQRTDLLDDLVVWMAAPKKRTSRKKKWLRHQRKFIKNREDIQTCSVCGNAKLMNHLCGTCFDRVQRETEAVLKDLQTDPGFWHSSIPETLKHLLQTK